PPGDRGLPGRMAAADPRIRPEARLEAADGLRSCQRRHPARARLGSVYDAKRVTGAAAFEAREPPYPTRIYAAYVVGVLFLVWFMAYLDRQILTLLLPSLKADLAVSDTQVSLIQGIAFASVYSVAGVPLGWIADRTNRRNLIVGGVVF